MPRPQTGYCMSAWQTKIAVKSQKSISSAPTEYTNAFLQDEKLKRLVEIHGERWDFIASHFADRADVQCQHRWQKVVNPELVKGPWTKEEDERVVELVGKYGPKR